MMEWIDSIFAWIDYNQDAIVAFLTSTNFAAICGAVATIIKNNKAVKNNTKSVESVGSNIKQSTVIKDDVNKVIEVSEDMNVNVQNCVEQVSNCKKALDKIEDILAQYTDDLTNKVNSMLEVQSIVYSTIKDDAIRDAVNTILIAAKYTDNASRAKLQAELEALKKTIEEKDAELNNALSNMMTKVTSEVSSTALTRY